MPEGDTIRRTAARLAPVLAGREVVAFDLPRSTRAGPEPGTLIDAVEAHGKYLLVRFGDGSVLETHMKMNGSWHLYRVGERWRRSRRSAVAIIEVDGWVAVCFSAPHVRLLRPFGGRDPIGDRAGLGPDLCDPDPDLDEVVARIDRHWLPGTPALDVVLDQRVFCGVGNVFKSEVLHACRVHPLTPIGTLDRSTRSELAATAHRQLRANLGGGPRTTVPQGLAVYGRDGQPCHRCGTTVEGAELGSQYRITYWCPGCQPPPERASAQPAPGVTTPDS